MQDLGIRVLFEGSNMLRLLEGLWVSISLALISMLLSVVFGLIFGIVMTSKNKLVQVVSRFYLEAVRIMPPLVLLFISYFGLARSAGVHISGEAAAIIVFVFWGTAEMGDLVRGALISIPKHQYNSGFALGLSTLQTYRYIIIPQTLQRLLPLAINLATRMIKTTSLVVLIGVVEVLKVGQQIIEANRYTVPDAVLWIYGAIFFLYFIACYPLSLIARKLEAKSRIEGSN